MNKSFIISVLCLISIAGNAQEAEKKFVKEISKLTKDDRVQTAFRHVADNNALTIKDLIYLTEIPAPPFKEQKRAEAFGKLIRPLGMDSVWIDEVGNLIALRRGTNGERTVVLDAHLDTVFPEETDVTVKKVGDTLKAPGIGDDTRGLAMMLAIARAMRAADVKTSADILFIGTVGEEGLGDLRGVKYIFDKGPKVDAWVAIDGGSIGRVNNAGLGSVRYKAIFKGKGGHSWGAFGLANPHHALGYAIEEFTKQATSYTSSGPKTSFNVGRIGGGTSVNSIPFESWMEIDMRSVSPDRLKEIESVFLESMEVGLEKYNATGVKAPVTLELVKIGDRPSGELSETLPLIQRALAATSYFEATPRLTRGSTNSNIPISKGVPAVTLGRGGKGGGAHSLHEWWMDDASGPKSIQLAMLILIAEARLVK